MIYTVIQNIDAIHISQNYVYKMAFVLSRKLFILKFFNLVYVKPMQGYDLMLLLLTFPFEKIINK